MITIEPIGYVSNSRKEIEDDNWGDIVSDIILCEEMAAECTEGLGDFSHIEVIFHFHLADKSEASIAASHPRGNKNYPRVGIFAQRKKARPNLLGSTIVKLLAVTKNRLHVKGLDAIDGTPIIDIKPVIREFIPDIKELKQPDWATDLMKNYWTIKKS